MDGGGGGGGWLLSNSGFLSESLPQDKMSDGNPGFKASLCALASVTHSNSSSPLVLGCELCATAAGVDCGTIRKVPQNPGTSEY